MFEFVYGVMGIEIMFLYVQFWLVRCGIWLWLGSLSMPPWCNGHSHKINMLQMPMYVVSEEKHIHNEWYSIENMSHLNSKNIFDGIATLHTYTKNFTIIELGKFY